MTGVTESGHLYDSDPVLCIHKYSSFQRISLFYHLYLNLLIPLDKRYDEILFDSSTNSSSFLLDTFFFLPGNGIHRRANSEWKIYGGIPLRIGAWTRNIWRGGVEEVDGREVAKSCERSTVLSGSTLVA